MPLSNNPYISSSVIDAAPGTGTNTQSQNGYNESPQKNALATNNSARNAGPNSALNGQVQPISRPRATGALNKVVQNQVNVSNDALNGKSGIWTHNSYRKEEGSGEIHCLIPF
jgi:hypothetical protein